MSTQRIDTELVKHIAFLTRLSLTEDETERFSEQLSTIIAYFDMLGEVDTADVSPFRQPSITRAMLRQDEVRPSMAREDFLANVPQRQEGYARVSAVLDVPEDGE